MKCAHLAAAFVAGAMVSTALWAAATPAAEGARYRALDAFAQALTLIQSEYVDPVDERDLIHDGVAGMAHNLDVHSSALRPRRYQRMQEDTEGAYADIGVVLGPGDVTASDSRRSASPRAVEIIAGSPADLAGIQVDDRVLAVDGEPTANTQSSTWQLRLRGASGTRVNLSVLRAGWRTHRDFELVRSQRNVVTVQRRMIGDTGVLSISRFAESTAADVRKALAALDREILRSLVLDLRGNPGGVVDQAVLVADLFLDKGIIVTVKDRHRVTRRSAHIGGFDRPVVVVVDAATASAAEIVAAALADNQRAKIVGERTYGKGTVQSLYDLGDGYGLKITTGRYYTPKGNQLESNGIQPDVKVNGNIPERNVRRMSSSQTPSAPARNGATIPRGFDDDPQLVAAVALARNSARGLPTSAPGGPLGR
jgi:carboxyl-terminal processing protease